MTARARITQAEMERAIRAAKKLGCTTVEVGDGVVRIVFDDAPAQTELPKINPADLLEE